MRHVLVIVRREPDAGRTLVVHEGQRATIGRGDDATLCLQDAETSRHHVALMLVGNPLDRNPDHPLPLPGDFQSCTESLPTTPGPVAASQGPPAP